MGPLLASDLIWRADIALRHPRMVAWLLPAEVGRMLLPITVEDRFPKGFQKEAWQHALGRALTGRFDISA